MRITPFWLVNENKRAQDNVDPHDQTIWSSHFVNSKIRVSVMAMLESSFAAAVHAGLYLRDTLSAYVIMVHSQKNVSYILF